MNSSLELQMKRRKQKQKTNSLRLLTSWWKKKRSYYVDMQQDDSSGDKVHDMTMEDVDSDGEETPIRGTQRRDVGASASSSPSFDVASMHSPAYTPPMPSPYKTKHDIRSSSLVLDDSLESRLNIFDDATRPVIQSTMDTDLAVNVIEVTPSLLTKPVPFVRRSFSSGSLESMDSLVESYWDPDDVEDDTSSQVTPIATNGYFAAAPDFFAEHVHFLRVQTRPHKVEVVWSPTISPKRAPEPKNMG